MCTFETSGPSSSACTPTTSSGDVAGGSVWVDEEHATATAATLRRERTRHDIGVASHDSKPRATHTKAHKKRCGRPLAPGRRARPPDIAVVHGTTRRSLHADCARRRRARARALHGGIELVRVHFLVEPDHF